MKSAVLSASLMPFLNEKQGSSFAHFLYFSNPIDPLNQLCNGDDDVGNFYDGNGDESKDVGS